MKTRLITPFFQLLFEPYLFRNFIFAFGNCQNSFSWGPPLVQSDPQNVWILEEKAVRLELFSVRFKNIHIEENDKPGFTFSFKLKPKFLG